MKKKTTTLALFLVLSALATSCQKENPENAVSATLPSTGGSDVTNISDDEIMSSVNMMLSSEGVLFAKEVKVTLDGWPDYVFGKDFRIMSLAETEDYIKSNGHLPGVPSASEIEEDGLSLGEMNRLLMQKVEELTLHIIELQKQVDELKANKE